MSSHDALQHIGEIEKLVIEYQSGAQDSESLAAVIISLSRITDEYGSTYHFVAEKCNEIRDTATKLARVRASQQWRAEKLKILILKECVALRRYVSRIKT